MPRHKLSTTVSADTYSFLQMLVDTGKAASIAEAVDMAAQPARRAVNRARLEEATAAYFARLSPRAAAQERKLGAALSRSTKKVDFDS